MDVRFCYLISADAGLAHDTETGENAETYVQVKLGGSKKLPDDYKVSHKKIGLGLAEQYGWESQWVTPISEEEYDRNCGDGEEVEHG